MAKYELTLSTEKLEVLNDFKKRLNNDRTISSNDVLSLESALGEQFISNNIDMRRLSERRSAIGVEEVKSILNDLAVKSSIANKITYADLINLHIKVSDRLNKVRCIISSLCEINGGITDVLRSNQFRWYYDHYDKLCDNVELPLHEWLVYYQDQIDVIFKHLGDNDGCMDTFKQRVVACGLDYILNNNASIGISTIMSFLLSGVVKNFKTGVEPGRVSAPIMDITVNSMHQLIDKRFEIKRQLDDVHNHLNAMYKSYTEYCESSGYMMETDIVFDYKSLEELYSNIKDDLDINFLDLVVNDLIRPMSSLLTKKETETK